MQLVTALLPSQNGADAVTFLLLLRLLSTHTADNADRLLRLSVRTHIATYSMILPANTL
jgi:hypothetical protein